MKTNNFIIINLLNVLNGYGNKRLPQKISYAITRNLMVIEKEYKKYIDAKVNSADVNVVSNVVSKDNKENIRKKTKKL